MNRLKRKFLIMDQAVFQFCRRTKKLSQRKFANRLGIDQAGLSRIESGERRPTEDQITKLCRAMNMNYTELKIMTVKKYF